jgi:cleavage stimulation factor subunit 3
MPAAPLVNAFGDQASQWKNYADMELADGEFKRVEEIFQKSLPVAWSVELFQFYLDYIRRRNDVFTGGELARTTIIQAYEFVISTIGLDKDSGRIWADYLDFVKSSQVLMNHFDPCLCVLC